MSLADDLGKFALSISTHEEYQKFRNGKIAVFHIGDCSRGYDDAEKVFYYFVGDVLVEDEDGCVDEIPIEKAIPIFFHPYFKRKEIDIEKNLKKAFKDQEENGLYICHFDKRVLYELIPGSKEVTKWFLSQREIIPLWGLGHYFRSGRWSKISKEEFFAQPRESRGRKTPTKRE